MGSSRALKINDEAKGISYVIDNIHSVKIEQIHVEKVEIDPSEENLRFLNPRGLQIAEDKVAGFSNQNMQQLKDSIRDHGLVNPIVARIKDDDNLYVIEGHRRLRAIKELISEKAPCFDINTGKNISAEILYVDVLVRIYDKSFTDEDCYKLSFNEDKTKVHFGPGAEIRFVQHCMMMGTDDAAVLEMLGNTVEWLRETKNLIRQLEEDEQIINAVCSDQINRTAAKSLAQIENWQERRDIFKEAMKEAELDCITKVQKMQKAVSTVKKSIDIAKSRKVVSEYLGDSQESEKYDDEIEELTQKASDLQERIDSTTPVVNPEALRKGSQRVQKHGGSRPSGSSGKIAPAERISTKWRKFFEILSEKGNIGDVEISPKLIQFANELLSTCTDKENDPEEFVMKWNDMI
jgi:ParB family chromosome partitioning protein